MGRSVRYTVSRPRDPTLGVLLRRLVATDVLATDGLFLRYSEFHIALCFFFASSVNVDHVGTDIFLFDLYTALCILSIRLPSTT
jgi:hypothetical protein